MTLRRKVWLTFGGILVLALLAGVVDYPKGPDLPLGSRVKELKVHLGLDLQGGALLTYEADMSNIGAGDRVAALDGARDVIERRVNAFGVSEPVIQTSTVGERQRIIVELPGVTDVRDAIDRIGKTPLLEFRERSTTSLTDDEKAQIAEADRVAKTKAEQTLKNLERGADFAAEADANSEDPGNTNPDGTKKGGDLDFADPEQYAKEFRDALTALKDGEITTSTARSPYGYHIIKREATRQAKNDLGVDVTEIRARHILFSAITEEQALQNRAFENTGLSGQHLKAAQVAFDPNTNEPYVSIRFNKEGTDLFGELTKRNVGKPIAIYLDGSLISAPTVQQEITGGEAQITGSFTLQEAKALATDLNAGALPVPVKLIAQQRIGPSLGQASIERSFVAGILGILLVSLFMVLYYRLPGVLAVAALGIYALLILAIFKLWPVTLTLAGIAGFILSIGMAVDANVLIFERLKEELRAGKPVTAALEQGFSRAWLSIRDSNVSSLITCFIMAWFGSSLVKGFAITLAIGIIVSMFSAITVTRTFLRLAVRERVTRHAWLFGIERPQA